MAAGANPIQATGTADFSGGVCSSVVPTIASPTLNPNGLARNQLVKLVNGTMRDGALSPRDGWQFLGLVVSPNSLPYLLGSTFQGAYEYIPSTGTPYKIYVIGGHVLKVDPSFATPPVDLSAIYGLAFTYPGTPPKVYFGQAGQFLVIQAGDYDPVSKNGQLPLFWNGSTLTQSNGITGVISFGEAIPNSYTIPFDVAFLVPAAGATVNIPTGTVYGGNLYDIVQVEVSGSSSGPDAGATMGIFQVSQLGTGYIQLLCLSLAGGTLGTQGYLVPTTDVPLIFTNTIASDYTLTNISTALFTATFNVPAVGSSVTISTPITYALVPGTTVTLGIAASSSGPNAGATIGTFQVLGCGYFGIILYCLSLAGGTIGVPNHVIPLADTPLQFSASFPFGGTQAVGVPFNQSLFANQGNYGSVTIGYNVPSAGGVMMLTTYLIVPGSPFPSVGDAIFLQDKNSPNTAYGTFEVTGVGGISFLYLKAIAPQNVGASLKNIAIEWLQISNGASNFFTIPPVGGYVYVPFNGLFNGYDGSIGDTISIPGAGLFMVSSLRNQSENTGGIVVQLLSVAPINIGSVFPLSFTLTTEIAAGSTGTLINQIPAATAMTYYMGRLWYATGATANAGDIIGSIQSGTAAYNYNDSVLAVTENPLVLGGDGFTMPSGSDNITGFGIPQMINASLGQGLLNIGTANAIFALQVPVTRADWIAADATNAPMIFVVQQNNGFVNDWSVVGVNGDLWYQSPAPDIRSLLTAVRYFQQWGGVSLSSNEQYILTQVNRALLGFSSGVFFDNRLWMTSLPQTTPYGIIHAALIPLDMQPISTMEEQLPPNWEGHAEGLQIFQLTTATFSGVQRMFQTVLSTEVAGQIELWEVVPGSVNDKDNRILWQPTLAAFTWFEHGWETELKRLLSGEMWLDEIEGTVDIKIQYIPDGSSCVYDWYAFSVCSQANPAIPPLYPVIQFQPGQRRPIVFPLPPDANENENRRPANVGMEFQPIITINGQCRIRGFFLKGERVVRGLYEGVNEL